MLFIRDYLNVLHLGHDLEATSRAPHTGRICPRRKGSWSALARFFEPERRLGGRCSLVPVEMFAKTLAKVDSVSERESLVTAFLGEQAIGWMEELLIAGPVSPKQTNKGESR